MKNTKISLLKKMQEDINKFTEWNLQHENDMKRLKIQEKKRNHKISEMKGELFKQENVVKFKIEEIATVKKHIKEALGKRRSALNCRENKNFVKQLVINFLLCI